MDETQVFLRRGMYFEELLAVLDADYRIYFNVADDDCLWSVIQRDERGLIHSETFAVFADALRDALSLVEEGNNALHVPGRQVE